VDDIASPSQISLLHACGVDDAPGPPVSLPIQILFLVRVVSSKPYWVSFGERRSSSGIFAERSYYLALGGAMDTCVVLALSNVVCFATFQVSLAVHAVHPIACSLHGVHPSASYGA
jgi:hypothetical protein